MHKMDQEEIIKNVKNGSFELCCEDCANEYKVNDSYNGPITFKGDICDICLSGTSVGLARKLFGYVNKSNEEVYEETYDKMFGETTEITIRVPTDFYNALDKIADDSYLSVNSLILSELDKSELFSNARKVMLSHKL